MRFLYIKACALQFCFCSVIIYKWPLVVADRTVIRQCKVSVLQSELYSQLLPETTSSLLTACIFGNVVIIIFLFAHSGGGGGVQTGSTRHRGHLLSYCTCLGWLWGWRIIRWNEDWQGKPKYSEKTCPSATLSTTNPTRPDQGSNTGRRGGKPATNRLSYGAANVVIKCMWVDLWPITVASRSKAPTVFARSNTAIVGSNLTQGLDVCVRLFCVCVVLREGSGLMTDWSPVQGVLPSVYRIKKLQKWPRSNGL
jgi:hypothetical protein